MTKKRFLLALALMLTAVGGAWAQGHQKYTAQVDMADLQVGDTLAEGFSLTGTEGNYIYFAVNRCKLNGTLSSNQFLRTINDISGVGANCVITTTVSGQETIAPVDANGQDANAWVLTAVESVEIYTDITIAGITVAVAPAAPEPGTLVENGNNQWQVNVPAGNVTLTVDYYGQYTLDSVPTAEGWQVKVNGTLATVTPYTTGSALGHVDNINETDSVELIPPAALRTTIKAVRLTESVAAPAVVEPITVTWNSTALSEMAMSIVSGSESRTQDDVTVTVTSSGEPMDFGSMMDVNGTGNFVFSTELGNITQIVISFSDGGDWTGANAGWPSELYTYGAGTFTWSGTPASSVTLSSDGASNINGITSIVFTIQPNN